MATVANLVTRLSIEGVGRTEAGLNRTSRAMRTFGRVTARVAAVVVAAGSVMGAALTAGLAGATARGTQTADALGKLADRLGTTVESLQAFQLAMNLGGISMQQAERAALRLQRVIGDVLSGRASPLVVETFEALNVSAQELARLPIDRQIIAVTRGLDAMGTQAERVSAAAQLFGERVGAAFAALRGPQIAAAVADIERLGLGLDRVSVRGIEEMNDSISRIRAIIGGIGQQLAARIAPFVIQVTTRIVDFVERIGGVPAIVDAIERGVVSTIGFFLDGITRTARGLALIGTTIADVILRALISAAGVLEDMGRAIRLIPGLDDEGRSVIEFAQNMERGATNAQQIAQNMRRISQQAPGLREQFEQWVRTVRQGREELDKANLRADELARLVALTDPPQIPQPADIIAPFRSISEEIERGLSRTPTSRQIRFAEQLAPVERALSVERSQLQVLRDQLQQNGRILAEEEEQTRLLAQPAFRVVNF